MALKTVAKHAQHRQVARNGKVAIVPEQSTFEPGACGRWSIVHPGLQVLFQPCERLPHPFLRCSADHRKRPCLLPLPTEVREAEKHKRLRLSFSTVAPVGLGKPAKFDEPCFLAMKFQAKLRQPFLEFTQEP